MGRFRRVGRRLAFAVLAGALFATLSASVASSAGPDPLRKINHIVVIYEENHSFDNLYGGWEGVNGRSNADAAHTTQVDQNGARTRCLPQLDVNLTSPPLPATCSDPAHGITSTFPNTWFTIDNFIPPNDTTCPQPTGRRSTFRTVGRSGTGTPGGCTRDLVHEFYQEQYQLNGGQQDRYVDRQRLRRHVDGRLRHQGTADLPVPACRQPSALRDRGRLLPGCVRRLVPQPPVADRRTRRRPFAGRGRADLHSIIDSNGMPQRTIRCTRRPGRVRATGPTHGRVAVAGRPGRACGDYAVNTMQPRLPAVRRVWRQAAAADEPDDRRRAERRRRRLGVVRGRLVECQRRHQRTGWTNGTGRPAAIRTSIRAESDAIRTARARRSSSTISRSTTSRASRRHTPGRTHLRDEQEFMQQAQASGGSAS